MYVVFGKEAASLCAIDSDMGLWKRDAPLEDVIYSECPGCEESTCRNKVPCMSPFAAGDAE